jgi:arginyl-tRNA synthetase
MMKDQLREIISQTFEQCREEGLLRSETLPNFTVELSRSRQHGDLATNIAMLLAKQEKRPPREIAELFAVKLSQADECILKVEIAGPGFINCFIDAGVWHKVLKRIEQQAERYGSVDIGQGTRVMVEFVSANPTGPLHIGHGRGAAVGDAVARVLAFAGFDVSREYYINDVGNQMNNLGRATYLRYLELHGSDTGFPDDLYKGEYIYDIARAVKDRQGDRFVNEAEDAALPFFTRFASDTILQGIKDDLRDFGVAFEHWFSERNLFERGEVQKALEQFRSEGLVYEQDGALWFAASRFGDEKDRVVVKEDGNTTYFASDIAYHRDKLQRGFTSMIDIWGADHHGYIPRMRSFLRAMGVADDAFSVILIQMVNLLRAGTPVAMSTRSGEFVTLREVMDEVGRDAARFSFLTRRSDAQLDFDLEVAKKQSDENPVYYVQYAHARICSIIRLAGEKGLSVPAFAGIDSGLLTAPEEMDILKQLSRFPACVGGSARAHEPHRIAVYLMELVGHFHSYYNKHRVLTDDEDLSRSRLHLMACIKTVLRNGLTLLGVSAPDTM